MNYTELQQIANEDLRTTATILSRWLQYKETENFAFFASLYLTPQQMQELTYFYLEATDNAKIWQGASSIIQTKIEQEIQEQYELVLQKYKEDYPDSQKIAKLTSLFSSPKNTTKKEEY